MAPRTKEEDNAIDHEDGLVYPESWGQGNQEVAKYRRESRIETVQRMEREAQEYDDYI